MMPSSRPGSLEFWPPYQAYTTLDELPHDAPLFNMTDPIVENKELFCRVPGAAARHCGEKYSRKESLLRHMESTHNASVTIRPGGSGDAERHYEAQKFYLSMMKNVDYPGKRNFQEVLAELEVNLQRARSRKENGRNGGTIPRSKGTGPGRKRQDIYYQFSQNMENGSDDGDTRNATHYASGTEDDTTHSAPAQTFRRRHGILSPDVDDRYDETEMTEGSVYDGGEKNALRNSQQEPPETHLPASHVSKRQRLTSPQPKVKFAQHDFFLIQDDEVKADAGQMVVGDGLDTKDYITLISDDEDKKPVVTSTVGNEEIDVKPPLANASLIVNVAMEDDIEDMEFELEKVRLKRQIRQTQLQAELEEVELRQKMAATKKRKAIN